MKKILLILVLSLILAVPAMAADVTVESKRVSYGDEILALQSQANQRVDGLISAIVALNARRAEMTADANFTSADTAIVTAMKIEIAEKLAVNINADPDFLTTVKANLD
jgi:opacity protein-like surface antigen